MVHPLPRTLAVLVIGVAALTPSAAGFEATLEPAAFLKNYGGFSAQDVARAAAGTAVARSIQADADEVAIAGAVSMGVSRQLFMERFRDIAAFKRAPAVLAIGRFSSPPSANDMRTLTLDDDRLSSLRRCRPGDCDVRIDAGGMARVQASLNGGGDTKAATEALREHLAAYAADYLARGDVALMEYHDEKLPGGSRPISPRSFGSRRTSTTSCPRFAVILRRSPVSRRAPTTTCLYWSVEKIASTAVLSLTHVIMSAPEPGLTAIASKQIYASHFFHASLGLTLVSDAARAAKRPRRHCDLRQPIASRRVRRPARAR